MFREYIVSSMEIAFTKKRAFLTKLTLFYLLKETKMWMRI